MIFAVFFSALAAGLVQGVTGFGAGIVMMMFFPYFFALAQAAGVSVAIAVILCAMMFIKYREYVDLKKIIGPSVLYLAICSIMISFSTGLDQALMKKIFGIFLVILAVYYLFLNKGTSKKELSLPVSLFCVAVSATCDAWFGIGGPLMVLYFLTKTNDTKEYLGTIQTFFMINCIWNTGLRFIRGILTVSHIPMIAVGMAGIVIGGILANKLVDKLNADLLKKLTYVMIGISGLVNLL